MTTATAYSDLHVRLDKDIRAEAEAILDDYGISPSTAINIFYRKIIEHEGLPFPMRKKRVDGLLDFDSLSSKEIASHIEKAEEEIKAGKYRPAKEVFAEILGEDYEEI